MRDHSEHIELKREEAVAKLLEIADFHPKAETVDLHDALGRVTARTCTSKQDIPNALTAQMDGIAVRFADFAEGMPDTSDWECGREFDWANTGTAMPEGFDTEIAIEQVEFDDEEHPRIQTAPEREGQSCTPRGASIHEGEKVLPARTRLTPAKGALLGTCGYAQVEVVRKPRVVFIPTGDELVEIGQSPQIGKTFETNGILLEGKLRLWGAEPVIYPCLPDDWNRIRGAVLRACDEADVVAINAGSSKGSKDFTMEILEEIGTVYCHETNHGPGRHSSVSSVNGTPVVGISGPPMGCEITADWYLKPLVDLYLLGKSEPVRTVVATLAEDLVPHDEDDPLWVPAGEGEWAWNGWQGEPHPKMVMNVCYVRAGLAFGCRMCPRRENCPYGNMHPHPWDPEPAFRVTRPVVLEPGPDGLVARPARGKTGLNLEGIDNADGYVCEPPDQLPHLREGARVKVQVRFPYKH